MAKKSEEHQRKNLFLFFSSSIVIVSIMIITLRLVLNVPNPFPLNILSKNPNDEGIPLLASPEKMLTAPIYQVNIPEKIVALTFDDGPHPIYTPRVLQLLRKSNIQATFFLLGNQVEKYPDIVKNILVEGHEVGSHGYSHHNLTRLSEKEIYQDISHSIRTIEQVTGHPVYYYRPVGGAWDNKVMQTSLQLGLEMILWSVDPRDWDREQSVAALEQSLSKHTHGGDIILLHDGGPNQPAMIKALEQVIREFQERGFRFVTVSELMALSE